jgi:hypothetical protein
MAEIPQYMEIVKRRKDVLFIGREAWCRVYGKSREEFAEELSVASGQRISRAMTDHWLAEGDHRRQMPAAMEPYWESLTRDAVRIHTRKLPQSEHDDAVHAVNQQEWTAWRWA